MWKWLTARAGQIHRTRPETVQSEQPVTIRGGSSQTAGLNSLIFRFCTVYNGPVRSSKSRPSVPEIRPFNLVLVNNISAVLSSLLADIVFYPTMTYMLSCKHFFFNSHYFNLCSQRTIFSLL
jgi:hypothetical protein